MQPVTLRTARLELSLPTENDVDAIYAACQDELIQRFTTVPSPYERAHAEGFLDKVAGWWDAETEATWALRHDGMLAGMIPGLKKAQSQMQAAGVNDKTLVHLDALISSMTLKEREKPELLNAKRKIRVAKGAGLQVQDVNRLLKMHKEMETAMKKIKKMGGLKGLAKMFTGGGGGLGGLMGGGGAGGAGGAGDLGALKGLPGLPDMPKLPPGFQNFLKK